MRIDHPDIDFNRLREIGWSLWDPIGLLSLREGWKGASYEDEYDRYLYNSAQMLKNNCSVDDVADYLFLIQSRYMGMGPKESDRAIHTRLVGVALAISEDQLIWKTADT